MLRTGAHGKANVNRDNREGEPGRIAWMGVIPVPINAMMIMMMKVHSSKVSWKNMK